MGSGRDRVTIVSQSCPFFELLAGRGAGRLGGAGLVVVAFSAGDSHLPLDIVDLKEKAVRLKDDFVCLVLCILLKECVCTTSVFQDLDIQEQFKGSEDMSFEQRVQRYVEVLKPRLVKACVTASSSPQYHTEVAQMGRQGVARFTGTCRMMNLLGIVENVSDEAPSKKSKRQPKADAASLSEPQADAASLSTGVALQLGNTRTCKVLENDASKLAEFVQGCLVCEPAWKEAMACDDFESVVKMVGDLVNFSRIPQFCMGSLLKKPNNYVQGFASRKLLLVCWWYGRLSLRPIDWERVDRSCITKLMPDMTQQLDNFPSDWNAADISWFLHGRPDRFPFSAMWACLFHKSVKESQQDAALAFVVDGKYVDQAKAMRESSAVEHHPANVFAALLG